MKYIITQSQFHSLVYHYLNGMFKDNNIKKFPSYFGENSYSVSFIHNDANVMTLYFTGENDSFEEENNEPFAQIQVHYHLVDRLVNMFGIRKSRVLDLIADWVSEKLNIDVDEIVIYPRKEDI